MKRLLFLLLISIIASAYPLWAQTYALEMGAGFRATTTPRSGAYFSVLLAPEGEQKIRSYTTIDMKPVKSDSAAYTMRTGAERTLFKSDNLQLNGILQAGVATGKDSTSGIFTGGGNVLWSPGFLGDFSLVLRGEASQAPADGGFEPKVSLGFRFDFQ